MLPIRKIRVGTIFERFREIVFFPCGNKIHVNSPRKLILCHRIDTAKIYPVPFFLSHLLGHGVMIFQELNSMINAKAINVMFLGVNNKVSTDGLEYLLIILRGVGVDQRLQSIIC